MSYPIDFKHKATEYRRRGHSIKEIAKMMEIGVGTASLWLRKVKLSQKALNRLKERRILGQYIARQTILSKKQALRKLTEEAVNKELSNLSFNQTLCKLLCSFLFWTEGGKFTDSYVYFMNSDPLLAKTFVSLLRLGFKLDESKFRALVHLHQYHDEIKVKKFWSDSIGVPLSQFSKSYLKMNTKKRIRDGYLGCIRIRYYDAKIALELRAIYNMFARKLTGVG